MQDKCRQMHTNAQKSKFNQMHLQPCKGLFGTLLVGIQRQVLAFSTLEGESFAIVVIVVSSLIQAVQESCMTRSPFIGGKLRPFDNLMPLQSQRDNRDDSGSAAVRCTRSTSHTFGLSLVRQVDGLRRARLDRPQQRYCA